MFIGKNILQDNAVGIHLLTTPKFNAFLLNKNYIKKKSNTKRFKRNKIYESIYANSVKFAFCIVLELAFVSKSSEKLMILELFHKFGISGGLVVCML